MASTTGPERGSLSAPVTRSPNHHRSAHPPISFAGRWRRRSPRGSDVVMEHWVHSRTDLENGTATWGLESSRVYTLAVMTNRALTVPIGTIVSELARRGLAPALLLNLPSPATAAASSPCGLMPVL
jgi:hypothetical protein